MPIHDWTRVETGIYHHFHHRWITSISDTLNAGLLPDNYYALADQFASGYGPDVLTLQGPNGNISTRPGPPPATGNGTGLLQAPPTARFAGETEMDYYRRKQNVVTVRHTTGDEVVAMVEIVSPGNKGSSNHFRAFVDKATDLLSHHVHLLIIDILPPGRRDPQGIHAAIWENIANQQYQLPPGKPLTLAAYEAALAVRAYVEHAAVGDALIDMPLFLQPGAHVEVPMEATYQAAFDAVPRRWRRVIEE